MENSLFFDSFALPPQPQFMGSFLQPLSPVSQVLGQVQSTPKASAPVPIVVPKPSSRRTPDWLKFETKKGKKDVRILNLNRICKRLRTEHKLVDTSHSLKHPAFNLAVKNAFQSFNAISSGANLDSENLETRELVVKKLNSGCKNKRRNEKKRIRIQIAEAEATDDNQRYGEYADDGLAVPGDAIMLEGLIEKFHVGDLVFVTEENVTKFIGTVKELSPLGADNQYHVDSVLVKVLICCEENLTQTGDRIVHSTDVHLIEADINRIFGRMKTFVDKLQDFCLVCQRKFDGAREKKEWIQCHGCTRWQHEGCRPGKYTDKWYFCFKCVN